MKKQQKKLVLHRETIKHLEADRLERILGGRGFADAGTHESVCDCKTD